MTTDLRILSEASRIKSSLVEREALEWIPCSEETLSVEGHCQVSQGHVRILSCRSAQELSAWTEALSLKQKSQTNIFLDKVCLNDLTDRQVNWVRHYKISVLAGGFKFIDLLNSFENVEYALSPLGMSLRDRQVAAEKALRAVELWEHRFKRPHQMSLEMRFRVGLAQAIAKSPRLVVIEDRFLTDVSSLNWLERVATLYGCVVLVLQLEA